MSLTAGIDGLEILVPKSKFSSLLTRVLSALVLMPVVLGAIYYGGIWFVILLSVLAVLIAKEWAALVSNSTSPGYSVVALITGTVIVMGAAMNGHLAYALILSVVAGIVVGFLDRSQLALDRVISGFGVPYICIPLVSAWWLVTAGSGEGRNVMFWILGVVWLTDTGAYAAGKLIGGPKLAPRISPNKTWAGLLGGMLAASSVAVCVAVWTGFADPWQIIWISALFAVLSQGGDLFESAIKRHYDVKDSGAIIPGHGGLFDRIDGLLVALPLVALMQWVSLFLGGNGIFQWL
ncbi:MAG: phosphatidate cytidylyltransferase [Alphaproteobacteria bacterium]|jgi:phosphatidate cytidylyltransferase